MNDTIKTLASTSSPDLLNGLIYITIILFVLSVITEKITQLVRQYPLQCQIIGLTLICSSYFLIVASFFWPVIGQLPKGQRNIGSIDFAVLLAINTLFFLLFIINLPYIKHSNKKFSIWFRGQEKTVGQRFGGLLMFRNVGKKNVDEKVKEKEISLLSFILGFIIAYLFNANLIELLINPTKPLGWGDVTPFIGKTWKLNSCFFGFDFTMAIGFIVSGFFLSFGSKFFHDLLDTLLQAKNLKRKLNDKEIYDAETIKQFDEHLALVDKDMVKATFDKNVEDLMKLDGVAGASCGTFKKAGKDVYGIQIFTNRPELTLEQSFYYDMPNGNKKEIPLKIMYQSTVAKKCSLKILPSDNTCNKVVIGFGSICFGVKDKDYETEKYLLTCYHVVKGAHHSWNYFTRLDTEEDKVIIQKSEKGEINRGLRNREIDAALIIPDTDWSFNNSIPQFNTTIKSVRPVYYKDDDQTSVNVFGSFSKSKRTGTITGVGARHKIDFEDGSPPFEMVNLIEIQDNNKPIAVQGDSGSLIFTDAGEALAMVVAVTEHVTLATPLYTILDNWNLKLDI